MWIYLIALVTIPSVYLALVILPWLLKVRKSWNVLWDLAPIANPHIFLGILPIFKGPCQEGVEQFWKWTEENPKGYAFLLPFRPSLMVHHPETVKAILKTTEPKGLIPGTGGYKLLVPWIGDGLLNSSGKKWQRNRRLITPAFHFNVLKPYIAIYNQSAEKTMSLLLQKSKEEEFVEIYKYINMCTLNVILKCAFSYNEDVTEEGKHSKYAQSVLLMARLIVKRMLNALLFIDSIYKLTKDGRDFYSACEYSHSIANNLIKERHEQLQKNPKCIENKKYVDFLDILLLAKDENGESLTDIEIRDEVETFLFEGHDTTSSGITWILYNLARHPDIQDKVYDEIDDLLSKRDSQCLAWDDMSNLPYLTMCIKESLRMYPPVPNISRELSKPMMFMDRELPPGTIIDINILNLHHNPVVWGKDHLVYNPDRFLPDNMAKMDPYAFIPFSAGPRNCVGQVFAMNELKVIVGRIVHRLRMEVDEKHEVKITPDVVIRPSNGIKLRFEERIKYDK